MLLHLKRNIIDYLLTFNIILYINIVLWIIQISILLLVLLLLLFIIIFVNLIHFSIRILNLVLILNFFIFEVNVFLRWSVRYFYELSVLVSIFSFPFCVTSFHCYGSSFNSFLFFRLRPSKCFLCISTWFIININNFLTTMVSILNFKIIITHRQIKLLNHLSSLTGTISKCTCIIYLLNHYIIVLFIFWRRCSNA